MIFPFSHIEMLLLHLRRFPVKWERNLKGLCTFIDAALI